ncbi:sigma factor-like helix-turn-helix DNA-binding protein [Bradyrhizobium japonicum]
MLVVGEGMTHAEAATALGVSKSTISGRMHEVRRQAGLAKDIGDEY